jgi:putative transposase
MLKAYKYRLYPNKAQTEFLNKSFGCARWVYNWGLAKKIKHYEETGMALSYVDLSRELTQLKKTEEFQWLNEPSQRSLQQSLRNLDRAFSNFFRTKRGFPKFKARHRSASAFSVIKEVSVDLSDGTVTLPKIGRIPFSLSRVFTGSIGTVTVSRKPSGKYYVSILVNDGKGAPKKKVIRKKTTVGIDLGIKHFAVLSTGEKIENPKYLDRSLKILRRRSRILSRRVKGSKRRDKAKKQVALIHERITNQRTDFLHKLSTRIIRENQTVALETLNVEGMLQNRHLSKAISQLGWSEFVRQLEYKSEWYGKNIIRVGTFEPTSKTCSSCGLGAELTLADRNWTCLCGITHDRDINAALNIKAFALKNTVSRTGIYAHGVTTGRRRSEKPQKGAAMSHRRKPSASLN